METNCTGNLRVIRVGHVSLEVRNAVDQHLQLDHAQRRVVEHNHLDGQVVHLRGDELAQQHRQAAVARHGHDLTIRERNLRAQRHRQCVGHGAVQE